MAWTSSIYDHFDLYLTPMTLTFNLPEKMFQMALLLLEGNNCAKLFWNPCINVQVMAWTSSIYDHFDLYLTPETLTFNPPDKIFQMALFLLEDNNCAKLFWNPCINVQVMAGQAQFMTILTFIWPLSPWPSTYLKKCFKWHFSSSRATTVQNCFEIHALLYKLWSGQIRTDARKHAHTPNKNCNNYVPLTRKRARQKVLNLIFQMFIWVYIHWVANKAYMNPFLGLIHFAHNPV